MRARWCSFGIGLGLVFAPLLLGYGSAGAILHDVAVGLLVCVASVAALDWPPLRFAVAAPALWLIVAARGRDDPPAAAAAIVSGALLLVLAAVPSAPRLARGAGARA